VIKFKNKFGRLRVKKKKKKKKRRRHAMACAEGSVTARRMQTINTYSPQLRTNSWVIFSVETYVYAVIRKLLEVHIMKYLWHFIIYRHGDGENILSTLTVKTLSMYIRKQHIGNSVCSPMLCNVIYARVCVRVLCILLSACLHS
jgi:hypothetical protein